MTAVGGTHLVIDAQCGTHAGGDSFLADVQMDETGHFALFENLASGLFKQPDAQHASVEVTQGVQVYLGAVRVHRVSSVIVRSDRCAMAPGAERKLAD